MATIVATMAMAHAPGVTGWLDSAPEEEQAAILAGYREMGRRLAETRPDVIVGVANDHLLNLPLKNSPDFRVGVADHWTGPAEFFRDWLKLDEYAIAGSRAIGEAILRRMQDAGVSVDAGDTLLFDDNWSVPLRFLSPDYAHVFVPIHMNCINPPIPGPRASFAAGRAIGDAIRKDLDPSLRVAVIGTGGLSHEPGGKRYFQVDETFDRWFIDLLAAGDLDAIVEQATVERMEEAGGGGTAELQSWLVALGASRAHNAEPIFYVPSVEMRCGIGGVMWDVAA
jgi:protocatechuate 4,5-dioxygenase beta chain